MERGSHTIITNVCKKSEGERDYKKEATAVEAVKALTEALLSVPWGKSFFFLFSLSFFISFSGSLFQLYPGRPTKDL